MGDKKKGNKKFVCGRSSFWQRPCAQGPDEKGRCPQADHPCQPQLSESAVKRRLAFAAVSVVAAGLSFLTALHLKNPSGVSAVNPGDLSAKHALAVDQNCRLCHEGHGEDFFGLAKEAITSRDMSGRCLDCHQFHQLPMAPHNQLFQGREDLGEISCRACHTEHKGRSANIAFMSDSQCHACHQQQFTSFSKDHPPFPAAYPHEDPTAIQFDHASHFEKHFLQDNMKEKAPLSCADCHTGETKSGRMMKTAGFDQTCASCHLPDIKNQDLLLFRLPEFRKNRLTAKEIRQAGGKVNKGQASSDFESVSLETPSAIIAYLLNIREGSPDEFEMGVQKLLLEMAKKGAPAFSDVVENKTGSRAPDSLLAGLNSDVVKMAAKAWISNKEYFSSGRSEMGGWHGDLLELRYKPIEHVDPVVKAWVDFSVKAMESAEDEESKALATAMFEGLTSQKNGAGSCFTCHSFNGRSEGSFEGINPVWKEREDAAMTLNIFKHDIHTKFLGGEESCEVCHELDAEAVYGRGKNEAGSFFYTSNFKGIKKDLCASCHSGGSALSTGKRIAENCLMCHSYHQGHVKVMPEKFKVAPKEARGKL